MGTGLTRDSREIFMKIVPVGLRQRCQRLPPTGVWAEYDCSCPTFAANSKSEKYGSSHYREKDI